MLLQTLRGSLYLSPSLCPVWSLSLSLSLSVFRLLICSYVYFTLSNGRPRKGGEHVLAHEGLHACM